ncbi:MAG: ABC-F family ATP-binding cassette domain-containing protein [Azospirillaceae bacterium]|nr:ABC-F family ATP-binding cassette domain-containing protein [Azospirillaceae bacterium]
MLQINDLTFRFGGRIIFDHATVSIPDGHRVALVGRNGTGKSTLLRLIAGELAPDGGSLSVPVGARMGMVAQEAPSSSASLIDTVLACDKERSTLLHEAETATDPMRIAEIHTRLADIGAHAAPARAGQILSGLGFDAAAQQQPCSDFSGGWRMRVALAGVLFAEPDLLLLDEPTNHLDLEATIWLESYLKAYPYTIILVSHDRDLLNAVPTTTIHLDHSKLVSYSGGYDQFERTRRANLDRLAASQVKQMAQRRHMEEFVERFRYKATKARQAQSRLKMLERMEPVVAITEDPSYNFNFPTPEPLAPPLIQIEGGVAGYGDHVVLRGLNLRIDMDDRIALLGANGNGKSTLVKLLAGRLKPLGGDFRKSPKLRIGYFAQHQAEELNLQLTALQQAQAWMPQVLEEKVRAHLGRFGFPRQKAETTIAKLSGGEKARLLFALMSRDAPNILVLDEPTNHLDIDSRDALVEALNSFEGAVILISHDPHLVELTADRLWLVDGGTCRPYDGDMEDYRALLLDKGRNERNESRGEPVRDGNTNRKDQRRAAAESRAALAPLRKKAQAAEKAMARLTEHKARIDLQMADPDLYTSPPERLTRLQMELGEVTRRIATAEEEWMAILEELEAAEAAP